MLRGYKRRYHELRTEGGLRMLRFAVATTLLAATTASSSKTTAMKIAELSSFENFPEDYREKDKREWNENDRSRDEDGLYAYQESTTDELATAVGHWDVGYRNTESLPNEQSRQSIGDGWRDTVPGTPGMDYPNLDRIPVTSFTCVDKEPGGYYADPETGCQVFHVCNTGGVKSSFLCPPGSIFNQRHFVCDWWYGFNCDEAVNLYFKKIEENFEIPSNAQSANDTTFDDNIEARQGFERLTVEYPQDLEIRNENPTNSVDSRRESVDYFNRGNNRMDQLPSGYEPDKADSKFSKKQDEQKKNNGNTPRGFSRTSEESSEGKKFDTTNSNELTNDLASYVNYAYFEAGSNDKNDNSNDDEKYPSYRIYDELKRSSMNDTNFVDKYVYGVRTGSRYFSNEDPYEISEGIEENE